MVEGIMTSYSTLGSKIQSVFGPKVSLIEKTLLVSAIVYACTYIGTQILRLAIYDVSPEYIFGAEQILEVWIPSLSAFAAIILRLVNLRNLAKIALALALLIELYVYLNWTIENGDSLLLLELRWLVNFSEIDTEYIAFHILGRIVSLARLTLFAGTAVALVLFVLKKAKSK